MQPLLGIPFHEHGTQRIVRQITIFYRQQTVQVIAQSDARYIAVGRMANQHLLIHSRKRIIFQWFPLLSPQKMRQLPDGRIAFHHLLKGEHLAIQIRVVVKQPLHARPEQVIARLLPMFLYQQVETLAKAVDVHILIVVLLAGEQLMPFIQEKLLCLRCFPF